MALEQKYLNVSTRAEGYMDIMIYAQDSRINIANVTSNDICQYSNIDKLKDIKDYTNTTIATLEENMWLLNGRFPNPVPGVRYNGYISNSVSNEEGNFVTNPTITIELSNSSEVENFSLILNSAVPSGYPKNIKCSFYSGTTKLIDLTKDIATETALPNVIFEVNQQNVTKVEIEFIGTRRGKRRIRLSSLLFGRVITLNQDQVMSTDYLDKCSYVPDSIPSRTFSFDMNNYDQIYNVDNPENGYIKLDTNTKVIMRNGYNCYGYNEETNTIQNPDRIEDIQWDDWKELRLLNVTTSDDTATFECGSVLDMMEDTYTNEMFQNNRTVKSITDTLMQFEGLPDNTIIFSNDDTGKSYGSYLINTVLPELPVRELIQLLAFSVGATLLIQDDGNIKFANLNLNDLSTFTNHHEFNYKDFASVPSAEQLSSTTNISLPKYNSTVDNNITEITKTKITQNQVEITYSECVPVSALPEVKVQNQQLFCRRANMFVTVSEAEPEIEVTIMGNKIETVQTQERTVTKDTLIIDTQLIKEDPKHPITGEEMIKKKYVNWYSKKFKYVMDTRGEPLVDAGDIAKIQTPFSGEDKLINGYILQNHITFDGTWSGDMEVIKL
ncbi:MAG: hypothetical protein K2P14_03770 [Anaeroplasmataceae bacterium]|nr:hypothetical protein [Anaeroplasmataceae bacterium]